MHIKIIAKLAALEIASISVHLELLELGESFLPSVPPWCCLSKGSQMVVVLIRSEAGVINLEIYFF